MRGAHTLNITQDSNVVVGDEVDSNTFASKTTATSDTMDVVLTVAWKVIVDHQAYL